MATAVTSRSNVDLQTKFAVRGFSLSGKVVDKDGRPIAHAQVSVSGPIRTVVTTAADGSYTLESLKAGMYSMKTSKQYLSFDTDKVDLQPMLSSIPDIVVDAVDVCGTILPGKQAGSKVHTQQRVVIYREDEATQIASATSDSKGQYCFSVESGQYEVVIKVEPSKGRERTLFFPKKQVVQLSNQPLRGLDFRFVCGCVG